MSHKKTKWVIVFLIYADFRKNVNNAENEAFSMTDQMKAELNSMFKDILTSPLDRDQARLYVIMNSVDYRDKIGVKTKAKTLLYRIDNPHNQKHNHITECCVISNEIGSPDRPNPRNPVQNPRFLKKILKENIVIDQDEKVFFITWDHGSAFGIFRETDPGIAVVRTPIHNDLYRYPYLAKFWYKALEKDYKLNELVDQYKRKNLPGLIQIGHTLFRLDAESNQKNVLAFSDLLKQTKIRVRHTNVTLTEKELFLLYNKERVEFEVLNTNHVIDQYQVIGKLNNADVREILSNDELAIVFQDWLGVDKKVSVLLMMNCWMMNLHTMYSFIDTVHCLVAPQSNIGTPGYNYKAILKYVFKGYSSDRPHQELAVKCVESLNSKRMSRRSIKLREDGLDVIDTWKIFAFDLQTKETNGDLVLRNQIDALKQLIDEVNIMFGLPGSSIEARWMYKYVRSVCFDFSDNTCSMVDIVNWCLALLYADEDFSEEGKTKLDGLVKRDLANFRDQIIRKKPLPTLELCSTSGQSVYLVNKSVVQPTAVVAIDPKGYSFFFPLFPIHSNPLHAGLFDNVKKDKLVKYLKNWEIFLKSNIDAEIDFSTRRLSQ